MKVEFPRPLRERMYKALRTGRRHEIGGILMAEQVEVGHFRIVDFTIDGVTGGASHFIRSVEQHHAALKEFYDRTASDYDRFNYLGEWHSHPNHLPIPSAVDITSMQELVQSERDIPFAMLLIVRLACWRRMLVSASLFQRHTVPEPIEILGDN